MRSTPFIVPLVLALGAPLAVQDIPTTPNEADIPRPVPGGVTLGGRDTHWGPVTFRKVSPSSSRHSARKVWAFASSTMSGLGS